MHLKWIYGEDPTGAGFFCPQMEQKRRDYFTLKILRPAEAEAVYQCRPGQKIGSIFIQEDFRYYDPPVGVEIGRASPAVNAWIHSMDGWLAQGWDTALSASANADWSVGITVMFAPCEEFHRAADAAILGTCDSHYDVYILDEMRARLDIGDLAVNMRQFAIKWNPEKVVIERKAHGVAAMQALMNSGLPVVGMNSHENKRDRVITGGGAAGSVQGWYRAGRVLHPSNVAKCPWVKTLETELKDFTGAQGGADDQVDALAHVINYGIIDGSTSISFPSGWNTPEEVDRNMKNSEGQLIRGWQRPPEELIDEGVIIDPFANMCGRCLNFHPDRKPNCSVNKWMVSEIHPACDSFDNGDFTSTFPRF
jgi:predicted phage terminase large subunit-like protein